MVRAPVTSRGITVFWTLVGSTKPSFDSPSTIVSNKPNLLKFLGIVASISAFGIVTVLAAIFVLKVLEIRDDRAVFKKLNRVELLRRYDMATLSRDIRKTKYKEAIKIRF